MEKGEELEKSGEESREKKVMDGEREESRQDTHLRPAISPAVLYLVMISGVSKKDETSSSTGAASFLVMVGMVIFLLGCEYLKR